LKKKKSRPDCALPFTIRPQPTAISRRPNLEKSLFGKIEAGSRSPLHNPASTHGHLATTEPKLYLKRPCHNRSQHHQDEWPFRFQAPDEKNWQWVCQTLNRRVQVSPGGNFLIDPPQIIQCPGHAKIITCSPLYDMVTQRAEMECTRTSEAENNLRTSRKDSPMLGADEEPNQEKRIEELRAEVERLGGTSGTDADLPADLEEQFLKHVLAYETAQTQSLWDWLTNGGLEIPDPDRLDDALLNAKLWEIIERMASLGAYLHSTDHLNDRQLYTYLFQEGLREETILFPEDPDYAYHIDLVGSGSDDDIELYLKYFAGAEEREQWAKDFPNFVVPPHEDPPFKRDQALPKPPY
jgi:hypothetical protein